jgi:hypothetical protein
MTATEYTPELSDRITLRALKTNQALSRETDCYSADVYLDGKKVAHAGNDGHGGPDHFHVLDAEAWKVVEALAAEYSQFDFEQVDDLIGALREERKIAQRVKRNLAKGLTAMVLVETSDQYGPVHEISLPKATDDAVAEAVALVPDAVRYRVVKADVNETVHASLEDLAKAYPTGAKVKPKIYTDSTNAKGDTLTFVYKTDQHTFVGDAPKAGEPSLYRQFCEVGNRLLADAS